MGTGCSRMAAEISLHSSMSEIWQPCSVAQVSAENFPSTSVAVVMTGLAPIFSARRLVMALAPPMWPESREMTKVPPSSITSTAGSVFLSRTQGAMARTAMPVLPMNRMASAQRK